MRELAPPRAFPDLSTTLASNMYVIGHRQFPDFWARILLAQIPCNRRVFAENSDFISKLFGGYFYYAARPSSLNGGHVTSASSSKGLGSHFRSIKQFVLQLLLNVYLASQRKLIRLAAAGVRSPEPLPSAQSNDVAQWTISIDLFLCSQATPIG